MAAAKKDVALRQLQEVFQSASTPKKWREAEATLVSAIASAQSAAAVTAILKLPGVDEAFLGEAVAGVKVVNALLDCVSRFTPHDAAQVLAWVVRACAFSPTAVLAPERVSKRPDLKPDVAGAIAKHAPKLEANLRADGAALRAASAMALCWTKKPTLGQLLELIPEETDASARAALLILLGSRCHGLNASQAASVVNLIEGELGHKQALVRFAAAYVQGRVDAVGELAAGVLTALLTKPGAVPEAWGWYGADAKPIRLSLAVTAVLRVSRIAEPQPLLAPLLKSKRPKVRGELIAYAGLISHLAFASAASLTQAGVVAHGLSATQRAVLQLFAQREFQGIVPSELGLPSHHNSDIKAFLAQKELSWCPIAVSSTEKRHFANILGGVIVGEVDGNMSLDAICKALEPKQVAMLACSHSTATMAMNETLGDRMDWRLSTEFCFELITRAHSAGLDIKALLKPALSPRGNEPWSKGGLFLNRTLAAAALLTFGAKSPPSSPELELIADGISAARVPEPLLTQVAQLPDKLRGPLVEGLTVSSNSLPFMKTWVSERSVEKIARFALRAFTPAEKQLAERTLVELGKGALPLLDRFEPKVGSDRRSLEGLRTRIVDALAKGKAPKAKVKTTKAKVKRGKGKPS